MDADYVIFFVTALFVVIGAGLFRVGLMNLKSESLEDARKARLYSSRYCLRDCSSADLSAEGREDKRLSLALWRLRRNQPWPENSPANGGMSAIGTQRTSRSCRAMSAFGGVKRTSGQRCFDVC